MPHTSYTEVQRYSNLVWLRFVLVLVFAVQLLVLVPDLVRKEEAGVLLVLTLGALVAPAVFILVVFRYELLINAEGIHYRFIPRINRFKTISLDQIQAVVVRPHETFWEKIFSGHHSNFFAHRVTLNITGKWFIVVLLKDGRQIKLGTENGAEVKQVLNRLHHSNAE